ncbi:inovirus-type Gp2 protein [Acinetobacter piscicola]|uniref:YagK/YfjJ domain-containing protein n=1 Tax=Acinetobacter piscicola TaxID=2006115 RepID=UPI0035565073
MGINESEFLIEIENYISSICDCKLKPRNFYNKLSKLLIDFNSIYNPDYSYFGCIEVFIELIYKLHDWIDCQAELIKQLEILSFVDIKFRFEFYITRHKRKLRDHRYSENENTERLVRRMRKVSNRYSRILVVRLDLAYKKQYHHLIDVADFDNDMRILRQRINNQDRIFSGLIEYAWALEQGVKKGYHCHLLLVYRGHEHKNAYGIAKRVGDVWAEITECQGYYFNCHDLDYLNQFEKMGRLGIGMIYRDDAGQVDNMLTTIQYLVRPEKEQQHLRVKVCKRMRTFG